MEASHVRPRDGVKGEDHIVKKYLLAATSILAIQWGNLRIVGVELSLKY